MHRSIGTQNSECSATAGVRSRCVVPRAPKDRRRDAQRRFSAALCQRVLDRRIDDHTPRSEPDRGVRTRQRDHRVQRQINVVQALATACAAVCIINPPVHCGRQGRLPSYLPQRYRYVLQYLVTGAAGWQRIMRCTDSISKYCCNIVVMKTGECGLGPESGSLRRNGAATHNLIAPSLAAPLRHPGSGLRGASARLLLARQRNMRSVMACGQRSAAKDHLSHLFGFAGCCRSRPVTDSRNPTPQSDI